MGDLEESYNTRPPIDVTVFVETEICILHVTEGSGMKSVTDNVKSEIVSPKFSSLLDATNFNPSVNETSAPSW